MLEKNLFSKYYYNSPDSIFGYDPQTFLMNILVDKHETGDYEELETGSTELMSYRHEHFHWLQNHGTTIGALQSLLNFSQELSTMRYLKFLPLNMEDVLNGRSVIKNANLALSPNLDLPYIENEDTPPGVFYRIWHDHLLVKSLIFESDLQEGIDYNHVTTLGEILGDALLALADCKLIEYPGNDIARSIFKFKPNSINGVLLDNGTQLTTNSLIECAATVNELFGLFDYSGMSEAINNEILKKLKCLFEDGGTYGYPVKAFLDMTGVGTIDITEWLPSFCLALDLALNPPVPPVVIDFKRKLTWDEFYPPIRFCNIAYAMRDMPVLPMGSSDATIREFTDIICRKTKLDNPIYFRHSYDHTSHDFDYSALTDDEIGEITSHKDYLYYDYILWVQKNLFELRRYFPSIFVIYGDSFNGKILDERVLHVLNSVMDRWFRPQFFSFSHQEFGCYTDDSDNTIFNSALLLARARFYLLNDLVGNENALDLDAYPELERSIIREHILPWLEFLLNMD